MPAQASPTSKLCSLCVFYLSSLSSFLLGFSCNHSFHSCHVMAVAFNSWQARRNVASFAYKADQPNYQSARIARIPTHPQHNLWRFHWIVESKTWSNYEYGREFPRRCEFVGSGGGVHIDDGPTHGLSVRRSTGKCANTGRCRQNAVYHAARYSVWFWSVEIYSHVDISRFCQHRRHHL